MTSEIIPIPCAKSLAVSSSKCMLKNSLSKICKYLVIIFLILFIYNLL